MHADRTNRTALTLFGLLILLAGAVGLTVSIGVFGQSFSHRALFANRVSTYVGHHGSWVWPAAAAVCLLIALAALRWIVALLVSTDRAGDIHVPVASQDGTTILQTTALTGAVTREISTYHGVAAAKARIIGEAVAPTIVLEVTASQSASLHVLHHRIEAEAVTHVRQALGQADLPVELNLGVSRR